MAGDWLKVEAATPDKPEVLLMAELLDRTPDEVFGKLFKVWRWFDAHSLDGHAGGVTNVTLMKFIDDLVAKPGFAACMKKVGWLTDTGVPNFDYHMGEGAKKRAQDAKRKQNERSRKSHAESVTNLGPEKRREEKKEAIKARATRLPKDWVIPDDWKLWVYEEKPGWSEIQVLDAAARFKDYWVAAPKGAKLDWEATWRNWVRNTRDDPKNQKSPPALPSYT